jgi:hypothetical protein
MHNPPRESSTSLARGRVGVLSAQHGDALWQALRVNSVLLWLQTICQLFVFFHLPILWDLPSIRIESRPARLVMAGHRYLNQCRMNGCSTRTRIRCATLRHAQMPKGSRRAPNVYRRVHSRPRHTAQWVGLKKQLLAISFWQFAESQKLMAKSCLPARLIP